MRPAAITAAMIRPLVRVSKARLISSMPNTMPASGVLKAAATPAAAPARIRPGWRRGEKRPMANMMTRPPAPSGLRGLRTRREQTKQRQQDLTDGDTDGDEAAARLLILQLTRRDRLRDAGALRVLEEAVG